MGNKYFCSVETQQIKDMENVIRKRVGGTAPMVKALAKEFGCTPQAVYYAVDGSRRSKLSDRIIARAYEMGAKLQLITYAVVEPEDVEPVGVTEAEKTE